MDFPNTLESVDKVKVLKYKLRKIPTERNLEENSGEEKGLFSIY